MHGYGGIRSIRCTDRIRAWTCTETVACWTEGSQGMKDEQLDSGYEYWDPQTSSVAWPVPAAGEMDCRVWGSEGNAARGQEVWACWLTLVLWYG